MKWMRRNKAHNKPPCVRLRELNHPPKRHQKSFSLHHGIYNDLLSNRRPPVRYPLLLSVLAEEEGDLLIWKNSDVSKTLANEAMQILEAIAMQYVEAKQVLDHLEYLSLGKINKSGRFHWHSHDPAQALNYHNWRFGKVDENREHFSIGFGKPSVDESPQVITSIARIGRHHAQVFSVQLLSENEVHLASLQKELEYYLNRLPNQARVSDIDEIWADQIRHCQTAANFYGDCHWRHHC